MKLKFALPLAAIILIALLFVFLYIIFYITFSPMRSYSKNPRRLPASVEGEGIRERIGELVDEAEKQAFEKVSIKSFDGLELFGNYYEGDNTDVINLCFHGYRGHHLRDFSGGSKIARDNGISHILIHVRGHGDSEGNALTFGINERRDLALWVDYTINRFGEDVKIVLSGVSMGAATVLMASDMNLPKNVVGIIADCPYSSPKEIIKKVTRDKGLSDTFFYPFIKLSARLFAKVDIDSASAIESVKNTTVPILIIHGSGDDFVPYEMGKALYDACNSPKKYFVTIENSGHAVNYIVDEEKYTKAVLDFFSEIGIKK